MLCNWHWQESIKKRVKDDDILDKLYFARGHAVIRQVAEDRVLEAIRMAEKQRAATKIDRGHAQEVDDPAAKDLAQNGGELGDYDDTVDSVAGGKRVPGCEDTSEKKYITLQGSLLSEKGLLLSARGGGKKKMDLVIYLHRYVLDRLLMWAQYSRLYSCLLRQEKTTRALENFHSCLKQKGHITGTRVMTIWSLEGCVRNNHEVLTQFETRAEEAAQNWSTKKLPIAACYPKAGQLPYPIQ